MDNPGVVDTAFNTRDASGRDLSFSTPTTVFGNGSVVTTLPLADGKVLVGGSISYSNGGVTKVSLARLNAKNAPAHIESQIDAYLSLYSQADQIAVSKTYADLSKRTEIVQPCLSLYMTTTPGPLFEAMSGANVEDGFLSRFLVFGSVERPIPRDVEPAPLPESVVSCFRHWEEFEPPTDKTLFKTPNPFVVHPDDEARQIFADFTARMHERSAENVLFTRAAVQAWKIALIGACGTGKEPAISGPLAQWACELVEYLLSRFAAQLEERSGHNDRERHLKELAKFIRERKKVTAREITRRFQRWDRRMRDELIADLRDAGRIEISESKSRGPASKLVTWTVSPRKTVSGTESEATTST
jgi:hypothetical protein